MDRLPLVIAHRGFSGKYPENTEEAFTKAAEVGADGFECDLRMSADGELLLFHDERLAGESRRIEEMSFSEINSALRGRGLQLCRPEFLLETFPDLWINFEIKSSPKQRQVAESLIRLLSVRMLGKLMISSFSEAALRDCHSLLPKDSGIRLSPILDSQGEAIFESLQSESWVYSWNLKNSGLSDFSEPQGRPLWLWTLNSKKDWAAALQAGVEAIITDIPDQLRRFLGSAP